MKYKIREIIFKFIIEGLSGYAQMIDDLYEGDEQ